MKLIIFININKRSNYSIIIFYFNIIFQLIKLFSNKTGAKTVDAIIRASKYLEGSYACGMQNANHPYNLYLFRKFNPIKILYYQKTGVLFFATREHFILNAVKKFSKIEEEGKPIDLIDGQGITFNLWEKSFCKFNLGNREWPSKGRRMKDSVII